MTWTWPCNERKLNVPESVSTTKMNTTVRDAAGKEAAMTNTEFGEIRCHIMNQHPGWQRFNYCQAWITLDNYSWNGKLYKLVKSYSTIVGIIDIRDDILWWEQKYSPTTSKQLTQIANRYDLTKQQVEG